MNLYHRYLCRSARWRDAVATHVPWVLDGLDLGTNVLEVGPGPGLTTDLLRRRVEHLTCVEIDAKLARALSDRLAGTNVTVLNKDATSLPFADRIFDGAVSFTMLHHVPSRELQNRLLSEVARVLRPGAVFAGRDSLMSFRFRLIHLFDTMIVVDPATFADRLIAAGFIDPRIDVDEHGFRFRARRTARAEPEPRFATPERRPDRSAGSPS